MNLFSDAPEQRAAAAIPHSTRRRLGQFFTPFAIAQFMASWVGQPSHIRTILDPAVGLGIFFRAILHQFPATHSRRFIGYDVDEPTLQAATRLFASLPHADVTLHRRDYLTNGWEERYDAVICNPPYAKFQEYGNRQALLADFAQRLGLKLSGLTNLYTLFLLKALHQLSLGGRAAFIVPSEFMNTAYGEPIKAYLLSSHALRYVIVMDFHTAVFDDALTTACILLFAKDDRNGQVEFITLHHTDTLLALATHIRSYPTAQPWQTAIPARQLHPTAKWRTYYAPSTTTDHAGPLVPFCAFAQAVRGIATGDNRYFCFSASKMKAQAIAAAHFLPCLTKASQAPRHFFTQADFARLQGQDKAVFLLKAQGAEEDVAVQRYLRLGEQKGVHLRYLTHHRRPWYALEQRPPAPILVTVFHRAGLRFVKNEAKVYNLTCFHCVYVQAIHQAKLDLLMAYLLSDVAHEVLSAEKREYGDGLSKFEPNDLNRARVLNLHAVDSATEARILALYRRLRAQELASEDTGEMQRALNQAFEALLGKG